jgi:hypothetical protein
MQPLSAEGRKAVIEHAFKLVQEGKYDDAARIVKSRGIASVHVVQRIHETTSGLKCKMSSKAFNDAYARTTIDGVYNAN